jgi:hypothetical protein
MALLIKTIACIDRDILDGTSAMQCDLGFEVEVARIVYLAIFALALSLLPHPLAQTKQNIHDTSLVP